MKVNRREIKLKRALDVDDLSSNTKSRDKKNILLHLTNHVYVGERQGRNDMS